MRVISGDCRGRKLITLQGLETRPTSDRIKEAVFNILGHRVRNARVLDLFAGSGALGIEALSRGAERAVFIDSSPDACGVISTNLERCRLAARSRVDCRDAAESPAWLAGLNHRFDLIFLDPPYRMGLISQTISHPAFLSLLEDNCVVIAEHFFKENSISALPGLDIVDQRNYGKTGITFFQPVPGQQE